MRPAVMCPRARPGRVSSQDGMLSRSEIPKLLKMGQNVNYSAPDESGTAWLRIDIPGGDWGQDPYIRGGWDLA
jgi:hypothetical protein